VIYKFFSNLKIDSFLFNLFKINLERQLLEEEERRQDQIESLLDVRKAKDLGGFYSNILKIKSGEMVIEEEGEKEKRLAKEMKAQKHYRAKHESSDEESDMVEQEEKEPEKKLDAKDESIDVDVATEKSTKENNDDKDVFKEPLPKKSKEEEPKTTETSNTDKDKENEAPTLSKEEKNRLRREKLFTKRTVGDKLDQEVADYFIRKSQFLSTKSYIEKE
jgi:DNA segregation ATPase FtsK/SpoIIIE-like protein